MLTSIFKNPTLTILALIMLVNALSYGTIIPLLYPYASKFGLNATGLGFLFASFSFFQFIATPIIGRLADTHGRKPLLLLSLFGTAVSQVLMATAGNIPMLFFARIFDGITGGNISVAQAVIADVTSGEERVKSFGILGAAFGFGFLFGPAIGGLLSPYGLSMPFWFSGGLALFSTILGIFFLPETLQQPVTVKQEPLINVTKLYQALTKSAVGTILLITLLTSTAQFAFIIGFQSTTVDVLKLSARQIGFIFTAFGLISVLVQGGGLSLLLKLFKGRLRLLRASLAASVVLLIIISWQREFWSFLIIDLTYGFAFAPIMVLVASLISMSTKAEDQGEVLGINQSFMSLGQIIGPVLAGLVAQVHIAGTFLMSAGLYALALGVTRQLGKTEPRTDL